MRLSASDYGAAFDAALAVLDGYGFEVDRRDYRFGVVSTLPKWSPSIAEVWIGDNTTLAQMGASTLNMQRRRVLVELKPVSAADWGEGEGVSSEVSSGPRSVDNAGGEYWLVVRVEVEQQTAPTRYVAGAAGLRVFSELPDSYANLPGDDTSRRYWVAMGDDDPLARRLLAAIRERLAVE